MTMEHKELWHEFYEKGIEQGMNSRDAAQYADLEIYEYYAEIADAYRDQIDFAEDW